MPRPRLGVVLPPLRHATLENENEIKDKGKNKKEKKRKKKCIEHSVVRCLCGGESFAKEKTSPLDRGMIMSTYCSLDLVMYGFAVSSLTVVSSLNFVSYKGKKIKDKKIPVCCLECRVMWMVFRTGQCLDRVGHPVSQRMPCLHFSTMSCCTPIICP